jgi:S-adenosylmethionine:tRNA ribosyltransferase-isomerase
MDKSPGGNGAQIFHDIPEIHEPGDCLVLYDSRVLPARLIGSRESGGGAVEVVLLRDLERQMGMLDAPGEKNQTGNKNIIWRRRTCLLWKILLKTGIE